MNSSRSISLAGIPRLLYTHNPFYLISALLVLYGIYRAVPADSVVGGGWLLLGMLCGYTLALALAGYVIIRFGQVWDDARTILLTLLLLFVALSAVFDQIVADNPLAGSRLLLLGLLFVVLISEGVLRGLKLRLAFRYRGPYYLILALLFCYPMLLGELSKMGRGEQMPLFVFFFPVASGLAFLTLFPAAHGGREREPSHNVPWTWPGYPWSMFIVLLVAVALRSYSFSLGFESGHFGQSSFQPFFLLPLLFAGAILFLELGISARNSKVCTMALLAPLGLLLFAFPGEACNPVAADFVAKFSRSLGSPIQWTVAGLAIFYAVAWIRGLRLGEFGLIVCVAVFSVVDRRTIDADTLCSPHWLPLAATALLELAVGLWFRTSWREMFAVAFGMATISSLDWGQGPLPQFHFPLWQLAVLFVLLLGVICDDRWARQMRRIAWPVIPLAAALAALEGEINHSDAPRWAQAAYLCCLSAVALAYWFRSPALHRFIGAMVSLSILVGAAARWEYLDLENTRVADGLPWLAWGSGSLALALFLSLAKGGVVGSFVRRLRSFGHDHAPAANSRSP